MTKPKRSAITWTDFSGACANFVWRGKARGECEFSPGCAHCYVMRWAPRVASWPEQTTFFPDKLAELTKFNPPAKFDPYRQGNGRPMVFVCDTGDYLHKKVSCDQVFAIWDALYKCTNIDWQFLTKRARRLNELAKNWLYTRGLPMFPPHMWMGITIEGADQAFKWEYLRAIPAFVRYVSYEPAIDFLGINTSKGAPNWIIIGGESGRSRDKTRPMPYAYARNVIDAYGPKSRIYFKQWGNWVPFAQLSEADKRKTHHLTERESETFVWFQQRSASYDAYIDGKLLHEFPDTAPMWEQWDKISKLI